MKMGGGRSEEGFLVLDRPRLVDAGSVIDAPATFAWVDRPNRTLCPFIGPVLLNELTFWTLGSSCTGCPPGGKVRKRVIDVLKVTRRRHRVGHSSSRKVYLGPPLKVQLRVSLSLT
jgi:hypothetical protein